jgi:hypothetical protein
MLRTILLVTRGIILDPRVRRWAMFILILAAMVMCFAGSTFLSGSLTTFWDLIIYWGICAWLTLAALLLALWDLLLVRAAARRERRRLEKQMLDHPPHDQP